MIFWLSQSISTWRSFSKIYSSDHPRTVNNMKHMTHIVLMGNWKKQNRKKAMLAYSLGKLCKTIIDTCHFKCSSMVGFATTCAPSDMKQINCLCFSSECHRKRRMHRCDRVHDKGIWSYIRRNRNEGNQHERERGRQTVHELIWLTTAPAGARRISCCFLLVTKKKVDDYRRDKEKKEQMMFSYHRLDLVPIEENDHYWTNHM